VHKRLLIAEHNAAFSPVGFNRNATGCTRLPYHVSRRRDEGKPRPRRQLSNLAAALYERAKMRQSGNDFGIPQKPGMGCSAPEMQEAKFRGERFT
jgi:hypothetical protein